VDAVPDQLRRTDGALSLDQSWPKIDSRNLRDLNPV
jgi:hypothetical protein